ncbi:MAG: CocE/NonD family hydrolase [Ardenticatenaceae bacterium]|nr:CocE/NonD family hydrolase [Ardenticatenaceae bacterium]
MTFNQFEITVERNIPVRMRDRTVLYADIYQPVNSGPFPVILQRLPYEKESAHAIHFAHPSWYARQGFVVVVQDTRGRWSSEGEWYPFFNEPNDGFDTVAWASRLPNTTGQVAMYGASYGGATQLLAAITSPPALHVICPAFTSSDFYEGWTYEGGALHLAFVVAWALNLAPDTARRKGSEEMLRKIAEAYTGTSIYSQQAFLPLKNQPLLQESNILQYYFDWLDHPTFDQYWKQIAIASRHSQITAAGLHIGGWHDIFLNGTLANYCGIRDCSSDWSRPKQRLLIGPWMHLPLSPFVGEIDFGLNAASRIIDESQIRFYNWLLKDIDDGISSESPVKLFVMGENQWREEADWPLQRAVNTPYYFHSDGFANSLTGNGTLSPQHPGEEPPDTYVYDPRSPSASRGGHSCCREVLAPMGSYDQRPIERYKDILCYTSERLASPLEVTGPIRIVLWAATTAVDTDWVAKLIDVYPDGQAMNLTEGIIRASYRESLERPTLLERERIYEYSINLRATSNVFLPGHRIRVDISSASFPHWDRNPNTGAPFGTATLSQLQTATQTIFHDAGRPSYIVLPIVPRDE